MPKPKGKTTKKPTRWGDKKKPVVPPKDRLDEDAVENLTAWAKAHGPRGIHELLAEIVVLLRHIEQNTRK